MTRWGYAPSEYWQMSPQEFWLVADEKLLESRIGDLSIREIEQLQSMLDEPDPREEGA